MKYKTLGGFKGVQNVPYCKADKDMAVGMGVILTRKEQKAALVASDEDAKKCHRIVSNIIDKPEMTSYEAGAKIKAGEFVRADDLESVINLELELADFEVKDGTADINVDDQLVFGDDGMLKKADAGVSGYAFYFDVIAKTAYMGKGLLVVIRKGAVTE